MDLFQAAKYNSTQKLKTLIEEDKMDVNTVDEYGYTALMYGVHYGHERVVELLLHYGADANIQNELGGTAYNMTLSIFNAFNTNNNIKMLLEKYKINQQ